MIVLNVKRERERERDEVPQEPGSCRVQGLQTEKESSEADYELWEHSRPRLPKYTNELEPSFGSPLRKEEQRPTFKKQYPKHID
jgi:hypothetical protein